MILGMLHEIVEFCGFLLGPPNFCMSCIMRHSMSWSCLYI